MLSDEVLSALVGVARDAGIPADDPLPGDLVVADESGSGEPPDPDAIGYLVAHSRSPASPDGTGTACEVWDVRPLSGRTHGGLLYMRWEGVTFLRVTSRVATLVEAMRGSVP